MTTIEDSFKRAVQGYRNLIEFSLVPAQHIPNAMELIEQCDAAFDDLKRIIQEREAAVFAITESERAIAACPALKEWGQPIEPAKHLASRVANLCNLYNNAVYTISMLSFKITWPSGKEVDLQEGIASAKGCVGPGWSGILNRLFMDLVHLGWDGHLNQVKEKFGGLRVYIGSGSEAVYKRIEEAEHEAIRTCETCGQPGKPEGGWIRTLCDACRNKN